jgi:hypothetical protein
LSCSSCGEDERPLNELLVLQLGANNISGCKVFGSYWNQEKKTILGGGADANTVKNKITTLLTFVLSDRKLSKKTHVAICFEKDLTMCFEPENSAHW